MLHLYYGNGKGKTTAAIGLAVRAAGSGKRVLLTRFLKNNESGELAALEHMPNISVMDCGCINGFLPKMSECERAQAEACQKAAFERVCSNISETDYDLIVLDEVLWLKELGIVSAERICALAQKLSGKCEVVMTGGTVWDELVRMADYVTYMQKICHPYDRGEPARAGVEF